MSFALVVLAALLWSGPGMCVSVDHPGKFRVPPFPEHFTAIVEVVDPEANMTLSVFNYYYNSHHHFEKKDFDYDGVKIVIVYDEKSKSVCLRIPFRCALDLIWLYRSIPSLHNLSSVIAPGLRVF